jgi:serine/threonine protein phosphatase PrpC
MSAPGLLLASTLKAPRGQVLRVVGPGCCGLAVGFESMNPKTWKCEDSVLLAPLPDGAWLAAVADAHWGGLSGELVAGGAVEAWNEAREAAPAARLMQAMYLLDGKLMGRGRDASETTALLVHVAGREVAWANVGDSLLYAFGASGLRELNDPQLRFVGGRPIATMKQPPSGGAATLAAGDVLLLASDGILPEASMMTPEELTGLLRADEPLTARVERLLRLQNERGRDNLGVVAIAIG